MSSRFLLPVLLITTAMLSGDETPGDAPVNQTPLALQPFVVTSELDKAREDIVPSLGATSFQIDKMQIDTLAVGANAGFNDVLLHVPGVAQDSFGQIHLRGEHANLQYRINDVLLPEGINGFGQELDTRFVQTVSVLTGSLPAQYGYRTAGVVDIHTRSGTPVTAGDFALYGGGFGTLRTSAEASGSLGRLNAYVTVSAATTELGLDPPTGSRDPLHDRGRQLKVFGYFSDVVDSSSRLSLMVNGSFDRFQIPNHPGQQPAFTLAGVGSFDSANLDENQDEVNEYAILAYQKTAGDFSAQLSAFTRYSRVHFTPDRAGDLIFNGVASDVRRAVAGSGFEADLRWSAAPTHTLRSGIFVTDDHASTRSATAVFPADPAGNQTSITPFEIASSQHQPGRLSGVYLQDEWKPAAGLTINYGARADLSQAYITEGQLSPRVNLVYQLADTTSLHAGYARYFTPPSLELVTAADIASFEGTTNAPTVTTASAVRSERTHSFDFGLSRQFTPAFTATVDGYDKRVTDLLDEGQFGQALIFSPFNYRHGHIHGVELAASYARAGFSAYINLALSRATGREIVSGEFQFGQDELGYIATHDVHLDHDQQLTASAGATYRFGATTVAADFLYGSGLRRDFANTDHLPEYHPVNFGGQHTFKLGGRWELIARLDLVNVFDEVYGLRDGSGIGVGAPQFGQRRGLYGGCTLAF
jgi:outer membrane receptor protein involved in Fe transport